MTKGGKSEQLFRSHYKPHLAVNEFVSGTILSMVGRNNKTSHLIMPEIKEIMWYVHDISNLQ